MLPYPLKAEIEEIRMKYVLYFDSKKEEVARVREKLKLLLNKVA